MPSDLTLLAPNEELNIDFLVFNQKSILVIVDCHSGYVYGEITKDQTTESVWKVIHGYMNMFGLPHKIISDGGPSFRENFKSLLKGYNVVHHLTSAFKASSNGLAERGVRSIKDVLKKNKNLNPKVFKELLFNVNSHVEGTEGSNNSCFYRRGLRSRLPNSIHQEVEHRDMVRLHHSKQ